MNDFYYLRHGATTANECGYMCGSEWDIGLSKAGKAQAVRGAEMALRCIESLKTICTSPLLRARQTANEVHIRFPQAGLIEIADLREWDFGEWSGAPYNDIREKYLGSGEPSRGETRQAFADRVQIALRTCLSLPGPRLLVSHGGVWMMVHRVLFLTLEDAPHGIPVHVYQHKGGKWDLRRLDGVIG